MDCSVVIMHRVPPPKQCSLWNKYHWFFDRAATVLIDEAQKWLPVHKNFVVSLFLRCTSKKARHFKYTFQRISLFYLTLAISPCDRLLFSRSDNKMHIGFDWSPLCICWYEGYILDKIGDWEVLSFVYFFSPNIGSMLFFLSFFFFWRLLLVEMG